MSQKNNSIPVQWAKPQLFFILQKLHSCWQKRPRLPTLCYLCNHYHQGKEALCSTCFQLLKPIQQACSICRLPLVDDTFLLCGRCLREPPLFDCAYTHYYFEEPLRSLLHDFKYHQSLFLRQVLAKLMLDAIPDNYRPDCLIPVPLHPKRLRRRGFNQAAELTKLLATTLQIPYQLNLCEKVINTTPQVALNRRQRQSNLRHAFIAKANPYVHVTLIDDLLTTGSTANELARVLKKQGVKQVDIWCCARTGS